VEIAQFFASETFLLAYCGLLLWITFLGILVSRRRVRREKAVARSIVSVLETALATDLDGKTDCLVQLNALTGARILTNPACRNSELHRNKEHKPSNTCIARATGVYLGLITATPAERHSVEGLRPARTLILEEYRRLHRGLRGFGDFIIRVALLGTFMGLIAALAIASANIGAAQGSEAAQSEHMRSFIQALLATAANKFWISAIGIGCALVVQIYEALSGKAAFVTRIGDAFDRVITDPELSAVWCPGAQLGQAEDATRTLTIDPAIVRVRLAHLLAGANFEPLNKAIEEVAEEIKSSAKNWVLSFQRNSSRRDEG
jgi:hypothetical protein